MDITVLVLVAAWIAGRASHGRQMLWGDDLDAAPAAPVENPALSPRRIPPQAVRRADVYLAAEATDVGQR